ncbi:MAG: hypothetical protein B6U95_03050 [Thermofilum sp. ex4484_82]|nr:MAG: hypothetical protein B6U95_03050 [Thermofilum sp. ex4484_82]OYT39015.1 MAG: hypothetical protein B6U96_03045 [Archaeoglobales archaeon ex4484_92]RLE74476.1 MAG: hypothetical protein DRZ80_04465 [Thermoprotei archaeon]
MEPNSIVKNFQIQIGSLIIRFIDGDGNPIPDLKVIFKPKKGGLPTYSLRTDRDGIITIRPSQQSASSNQQSNSPNSSILPVKLQTLKDNYVLQVVDGYSIANIYLEEEEEPF